MRLVIFLIFVITLYQTNLYSKTIDNDEFNPKYLSKYFSGLVSQDNQDYEKSLKFFDSSKILIDEHDIFFKEYIFSLVLNDKVSNAINRIKLSDKQKKNNFFEGNLILVLDSIKEKKFKNADIYLKELKKFSEDGTYEFIIYKSLKSYNDVFLTNKFEKNAGYGKIGEINDVFQNCYLNNQNTKVYFENLLNSPDGDYERYKFFYLKYLIKEKNFLIADQIADTIDPLNSSLLLMQAKSWLDNKKHEKFSEYFSCNNETDILSEFFFLISNLYSSDENYKYSEFYLKISYYLNSRFYFNIALEVDNHFVNKSFDKSSKALENILDIDGVYKWYKVRKKSQIISILQGQKQSQNFIEKNFKKINQPSLKMYFDMGNIHKRFGNYKKSVYYYSLAISKIQNNKINAVDILYRRGGSYERMGDYENSDKDLLNALKIEPEEPYILNYLAYSWLERNKNIQKAMEMLETAYSIKENDPYIIDSIGWAYYMTEDYINAEKFIQQAVILMPDDPIVNDHYADILWKLNRKIQARYFWGYVLTLDDSDEKMKKSVSEKIVNGLI